MLLVEATFGLVCLSIAWKVMLRLAILVTSCGATSRPIAVINLGRHVDLSSNILRKFDLIDLRRKLTRVLHHGEVLLVG